MAEFQSDQTSLKVFISGAPRSGTSILVFALKDVFRIPGFGESHVMPAFQRMIHALRGYTNGLAKISDPIMLKKLNRVELEEYLFEYIRNFYLSKFPENRWIDKTPTGEAMFGFPLIEAIFPDARLIVTKRNGIEVVTSHVKKFNSSFEDACLSWLNAMKGLLHARSCQNLLEVDQFDFQNATEIVSARIASHLGAPDRREALARYFTTKRVETSSNHEGNMRLRLSDIEWSDDQKAIFKRLCGEMMQTLGYPM